MKSYKLTLVAAVVTVAVFTPMYPGITQEHKGQELVLKTIKARQAGFRLYNFYASPLFGMAKGKLKYDAKLAKSMSENLRAVTHLDNGIMWLKGSDNIVYAGKTRALPEIWNTYPKFTKNGQILADATTALAKVAGNGLDALRSEIGNVGNACKNCHKTFRAEKF